MKARVVLGTLCIALTCCSAASVASAATVPEAWAGIWVVSDTTYTGGGSYVVSTSLDTLCTGEEFDTTIRTGSYGTYPDPSCTGAGFTDTDLILNCTVTNPTCTIGYNGCYFNSNWNWHKVGDVATTSYSYYYQFAIDVHHPIFGGRSMSGIRTRIANVDAACGAVPTRRRSWGSLKLLYR